MAWLSQVTVDAGYVAGVGVPMLLIGAGQGLAFAPLTRFGIAEVSAADAGAASGLLNTSHQLGSSVGLAILVAVSATAAGSTSDVAPVVDQMRAALTGSSVMLLISLAVSLIVILPKEWAERRAARVVVA